jgi:phosphate transport system substrate-binding protein
MRNLMLWTVALLALGGLVGCGGGTATPTAHSGPVVGGATRLTGAGSSFINPLMLRWAQVYREETEVEIDYTSVGSTKGITEMTEDRVAYGCTDAPMTDEQLQKVGGGNVIHVPLVMGAVVPIYHVEGVENLHLTGEVLAKIYLDKISHWDAEEIKNLNKDAKLPHEKIVPVRRADGSGTSFIFTSFLYSASKEWQDEVGKPSTNPAWKTKGLAKEKNPGVAQAVVQTPNTIGYVDLRDALQLKKTNPLQIALVANAENKYVPADLTSIKEAAKVALKDKIPEDFRQLSIINPKGEGVYPICGTVYAVCKVKQPGSQGEPLSKFLRWCLTEGQKTASSLDYAQLPEALAKAALKNVEKIK